MGVRPTPRTQPLHNLTFDLATQNSCTMVEPRTVVVPAGKTVSTEQDYVTFSACTRASSTLQPSAALATSSRALAYHSEAIAAAVSLAGEDVTIAVNVHGHHSPCRHYRIFLELL